ncbi:MAG: hypothetical protein ACKOJF_08965, partial [Planctomycetaceae bacterium]
MNESWLTFAALVCPIRLGNSGVPSSTTVRAIPDDVSPGSLCNAAVRGSVAYRVCDPKVSICSTQPKGIRHRKACPWKIGCRR